MIGVSTAVQSIAGVYVFYFSLVLSLLVGGKQIMLVIPG
jgi:hypothetical protein